LTIIMLFFLLSPCAAGSGVPFWAIAGFSLRLPKSGPWMDGVKSIFGIALCLAGLYYLRVVFPPLAHLADRSSVFIATAIGVVVLGLLLGAVHGSFHGSLGMRVRKGLGIVLVVAGLFASINYALTPKLEIAWLSNETAALDRARVEGKPVVMDFTAEWCLPCREFAVGVFAHPEVAAALQDFILVKIDLTREDEDESLPVLKKRYGVDTLPAVRFLSPDGTVIGRVDRLIPWQEFRNVLATARNATAAKPL